MDDGLRRGAFQAEGVDVRHHVVADLFFPRAYDLIVDVVKVCAHLTDLFLRDVETQFLLGLCQIYPEPPPGGELVILREHELHLFARIARAEGINIAVGHTVSPYKACRSCDGSDEVRSSVGLFRSLS